MIGRRLDAETRATVRRAIDANSADLLAYFERRVEVRADAADLLSETMLQTWRRAAALPSEDAVEQRMWLFVVARHVLANHRRASGRRAALAERLRHRLEVADQSAVDAVDAEALAVRSAVAQLPPHERELVVLVHWDGFTLAQVSRLTGANASTVRSRYAGARARLRALLADELVVDEQRSTVRRT